MDQGMATRDGRCLEKLCSKALSGIGFVEYM